MREIKFRAWDKINQQMVYNIQEMYDGYCDETDNGKYLEQYLEVVGNVYENPELLEEGE